MPLYPSIRRDISLVIKDDTAVGDLLKVIQEKAPSILKETKVFDYYKGRQIPQGFKGITLSCLYLSSERTLTDEEVNSIHLGLRNLLKQRFSAQIR